MRMRWTLDRDFPVGEVDPRLFGSFVEHLGRCVYTGIYEPGHPAADGQGFRQDVLALVRELGVTVVRYPGGNFVSGFRWEDSVGPREARPRRLDRAWMSLETNEFGLNEFIRWCRAAEVEPMMAVNLGTRGPLEAGDLCEYCNHPGGTRLSDLRHAHGHAEPHGIRLWCLGNEMDGPWQMGTRSAQEYGWSVREAAKLMRWPDRNRSSTDLPRIEFVACGSSHAGMPTFGQWEADVLDVAFDQVDYLSLHSYFGNQAGDVPAFLACAEGMDRFIREVVATCDFAAARRKSRKRIMLSFDEWNVWYHSMGEDCRHPAWSAAPPLLEDAYDMADVLAVGGMLATLINHADRVRIACLAQLVNVIAPIMTRPGGPAWRQTIFHPFAQASRHGRGIALRQAVDCPTYRVGPDDIPYLASAAVFHPGSNGLALFAVNRSLDQPLEAELDLRGFGTMAVAEWLVTRHDDLAATNSEQEPERVRPVAHDLPPSSGKGLRLSLPPASWNVIRLRREG